MLNKEPEEDRRGTWQEQRSGSLPLAASHEEQSQTEEGKEERGEREEMLSRYLHGY